MGSLHRLPSLHLVRSRAHDRLLQQNLPEKHLYKHDRTRFLRPRQLALEQTRGRGRSHTAVPNGSSQFSPSG